MVMVDHRNDLIRVEIHVKIVINISFKKRITFSKLTFKALIF
jgi:hypothetical protein